MLKTVEKEITRKEIIVEDIICNKCGGSCGKKLGDSVDYYGLIEYEYVGGYLSKGFVDGMKYKFSICEECLYQFVLNNVNDPWEFPPEETGYFFV